MHRVRRAFAFAAVLAAWSAAGCVSHAPPSGAPATPLPAMSAEPAPSPEAPIASVAPVGETNARAQILITFDRDVLPVQQLETDAERALLAHFSIEPPLPGAFRVLTPRMVAFQADREWPNATRVRVVVAPGVAPHRVSWTFQTPAVAMTALPSTGDGPQPVRPRITIDADGPLDRASLAAHATLRAHGGGDDIALIAPPDTATASPSPSPAADATTADAGPVRYVLAPSHDLALDTLYDLTIAPGVAARSGNRATERAYTGSLRTHGPFRFLGVGHSSTPVRFAGGDPHLHFSTPVDPASLDALSIAPKPPAGTHPFVVVSDGVAIDPTLFAPNSTATVSIGPTLRDQFGQQLGSATTATVQTGALLPSVWAPDGTSLFAAGSDVRLNIVAVNPPPNVRATFQPLQPADVVHFPDPSGATDRNSVLASSRTWPVFAIGGARDVEQAIDVPLRARLGAPAGVLAYGIAVPGSDGPAVTTGVVQLTDLGVFARWFPDGGDVRVHRIAGGAPIAGATVDVYPAQADADVKTPPTACAHATTDAQGVATFSAPAFHACAALDAGASRAPSLVTIVRHGDDWTYVRTDDSSGAYTGDFWNGWSSATPIARGTIFTDRSLYQPGETVQCTAVGWFLVDGRLRRGVAPSYGVTLDIPGGRTRDLGRRSLDAYGMTSLAVPLPADAPLGNYVVHANAGNGEAITGYFRVAEFKPPNFKVDLHLSQTVAHAGERVAAHATSTYLFGAPLTGAPTAYTVTRSPSYGFTPKGRDAYQFGRQWNWPEQMPDASTDVVAATVRADASGATSLDVPVDATLPYAMTYTVAAETTDAANVASGTSATFAALPSTTLIGIKAGDVATAGTPLTVDTIVTDPAGAVQPSTHVHVELQRATYAQATQIVEGAEQPVTSVSYATVASADTDGGDTRQVRLTPPNAGSYRLRATAAGDTSGATETDVALDVAGPGAPVWYAPDPSVLSVKLDRDTYKPDDTATVLVRSPFDDAELHVAVVRHGVLWSTTRTVHGAAPVVRFTVTPDMLPNAAVQAIVVRRGTRAPSASPDGGNALARTGFASLRIALDGRRIGVQARATTAVAFPGAHQTVRIHLAQPGRATVAVVNDAVLQLTGYRFPDLVASVYDAQPVSLRFADNRTALVLATARKPLDKGWGYGGGLSSGDEDPRVRKRFAPLAYFKDGVLTDAAGDATVSFDLPDDLTTWRVMVTGATTDGRFGNGETTFRTTKAVIANPAIPQFARPGDRFDAGLSVTNGIGAQGPLHVDGTLGGPLAFAHDSATMPQTALETTLAQAPSAYRFGMVATGTGTATATFRARAGAATDAFAVTVPVRDTAVLESVAYGGATHFELDVSPAVPRDAGGLAIFLASHYPPAYMPAAQASLRTTDRSAFSSAARLTIASDLVQLGYPQYRANAQAELASLRGLRRAGGGFAAYWRADDADPWDSLRVLAALGAAHAANTGDAELLAGASAFAAHVLADPAAVERHCDSLCRAQLRLAALDALAAAGDRRTTFLDTIEAQLPKLSLVERAQLARLLTGAPGAEARAAAIAQPLFGLVSTGSRDAAVNLPARIRWYTEPAVLQAAVVRLAAARNVDAGLQDRLVNGLLSQPLGIGCTTAAALEALRALPSNAPADMNVTARVGATTAGVAQFKGARAPGREIDVPMARLASGRVPVAIETTGTGTLFVSAVYRYRIAGAAPGRLAGMRVTRTLRAAQSTTPLATFGLHAPVAPVTLAPGRVFDVDLEIVSDRPADRIVIDDPLPAGVEAVDTTFATSAAAGTRPESSWSIGDQQIHSDGVTAYADHLDAGSHHLHYLVRTVTPGTFAWPGASATLAATPERFGRTAAGTIVVK